MIETVRTNRGCVNFYSDHIHWVILITFNKGQALKKCKMQLSRSVLKVYEWWHFEACHEYNQQWDFLCCIDLSIKALKLWSSFRSADRSRITFQKSVTELLMVIMRLFGDFFRTSVGSISRCNLWSKRFKQPDLLTSYVFSNYLVFDQIWPTLWTKITKIG